MNINFKKELEKAKKSIDNQQKQIIYARKNLKVLHKYIVKLKRYFGDENIEIRDVIYDEFDNEIEEYTKVSGTGSIQRQENILQILSANPRLVDKIYNKIKDEDLKKINLSDEEYKIKGNEEECAEFEVKLMVQSIRKEEIDKKIKNFIERIINPKDENEKRKFKKQIAEDPELKDAIQYTKIYMTDDERESLNRYIEYRKDYLKNTLFELEKKCFKLSGKFLKKYDLLEEPLKQQNEDYKELSMPKMQYKLRTEKDDKDIGLENIFTDEYIDTLDVEKLSVLNAFWQNRFTKRIENVKEAIFIADTLNLWGKLENEDYEDCLSDEQIIKTILKMKLCDNISNKIKGQITKFYEAENYRYSVMNMKDISPKLKEEYTDYFNTILPESENNFDKDLLSGQSSRNNIDIIYLSKSNMLKELLLQIDYNRKITNWGYMPENPQETQIDKKKILLGIDYPGFNMPLRLHADKEDIIEFFKTLKNSAIIPMYEGYNDMRYKGRNLTTKILMPLTDIRETEIIYKNKTINPVDLKYNYTKHLGNLVTKKCKKISQIYPHKYIDLESGKTGIKMNGNFVPDKEQKDEEEKTL